MGKTIDLTGQRFGRLVVKSRAPVTSHRRALWHCVCDCGGTATTISYDLHKGHTTSCGCKRTRHGETSTREHHVWRDLINRCHNPRCKSFHRYGARGIQVCTRWRTSYELFRADMGVRPSKDHSIERIDNEGDYTPQNCRWATRQEQANNRRTNRRITFNGETRTLTEWARHLGINRRTLFSRFGKGWPLQRALTPTKTKLNQAF